MIELRPAKYLLGRLAPMDNNDKIPQFNLGAGTYNSTVYLRGDGVWANPLAGAGFVPLTRELTINGVTYDLSANRTWTIDTTSATWGNITGTLSNQTDLQNALNAKQDDITLTTTGTSGAATFIGNTLNIPQYDGGLIGYVPYTGATANVNLGEYGLSAGWVQIDTTPTTYTPGVGKIGWNDQDGTLEFQLKGGNVTLQIGQEQVSRVVNKTDPLIDLLEANYPVVKVTGAQGNRLKVALAQANNDANSAETLGIVTENILGNQEGFITTSGLVRNINTTGSLQGETWADGDMLYLSGTIAGQITKVKPSAPIHTVILGYVVRAHATQGQIYVKVDNGYELGELHDVNTNLSKATPVDADSVLLQDTADSNIWKKLSWLNTKATLKTYFDTLYQAVGSYVPSSRTITINSTTQDLSANRSWNVGTVTSVSILGGDRIDSYNGPITNSGEITLSHGIGDGLDVQQAQDLMNRVIIEGGSFEAFRCLATSLGELGELSTPTGTFNSEGSVVQNIMLDEFGHIVGLGSYNLDNVYFKKQPSESSSILRLDSTTQGFLPPRMEEYQRDAISAADGLIVFNINTQELNIWAGGSWRKIVMI